MLHRILVALDESDSREQVLETAIALAKPLNAQLRLVHILTSAEADFPHYPLAPADVGFIVDEAVYDEVLQRYAQEQQDFEARHLGLLCDMAHDALAQDIAADYCLVYGSPGKQICDMARAWNADVIVIGRRGNVGLKELWLGSVSNYVVHHAPCAVFVVQEATAAKAISSQAA
jgi:nucleotide-binding universal stress UspA family protein